jgi:predicted secreted Zn-dependent protease
MCCLPLMLAAAALVTPVAAQGADALADISGVRIVRYDVAGENAAAIRADIQAKGPVDPNNPAQSFGGATDFSIRWRWPIDANGRCDLARARVSFAATVTLPRLTGTIAPALQEQWDRYIVALERHEAVHVRYANGRRRDILAAIRGARCKTADAAANAVLADIVAHERAIDTATRHGASDDIVFP